MPQGQYSDTVMEHFTNPRNMGKIENAEALWGDCLLQSNTVQCLLKRRSRLLLKTIIGKRVQGNLICLK